MEANTNPLFTRKELAQRDATVISRGRWGNADLLCCMHGRDTLIVKDFSSCARLIKATWGKFMVARELRALQRLDGIQGIPPKAFLLDEYAFCYEFIPGRTLKEARKQQKIGADYFLALEKLVREMHDRNIVHLDIRYMRNILITDEGAPALLDFQSSLCLDRIPGFLHLFLKDIDISGVYKCWKKISPQTIDTERQQLLKKMEKKRSLWIFKGYPLGTRASRR